MMAGVIHGFASPTSADGCADGAPASGAMAGGIPVPLPLSSVFTPTPLGRARYGKVLENALSFASTLSPAARASTSLPVLRRALQRLQADVDDVVA